MTFYIEIIHFPIRNIHPSCVSRQKITVIRPLFTRWPNKGTDGIFAGRTKKSGLTLAKLKGVEE